MAYLANHDALVHKVGTEPGPPRGITGSFPPRKEWGYAKVNRGSHGAFSLTAVK